MLHTNVATEPELAVAMILSGAERDQYVVSGESEPFRTTTTQMWYQMKGIGCKQQPRIIWALVLKVVSEKGRKGRCCSCLRVGLKKIIMKSPGGQGLRN
jgi:hypothetical protein